MKKIKLVLLFLILGFFVLIGCSTEEETPSFSLRELASVALDNEVRIYRNEVKSENNFSQKETIYDLDAVSVTEDEIIIEYNGQTEIFERLSSSVVQNEDRIQYEYFGPPEE